jgi:hypothetical protein
MDLEEEEGPIGGNSGTLAIDTSIVIESFDVDLV